MSKGAAGETPPLTRGRQSVVGSASVAQGNTPAYAGKTPSRNRSRTTDWKHPRLRGEDLFPHQIREILPETPPLTRGRPVERLMHLAHHGNTPAYAGKTDCQKV